MSEFMRPAPEPATELGRYRILSSTAGIRVSPLQLGGMSLGDAWGEALGAVKKDQAFNLLDAFVERGGNFIDTANNYQNEQSESWIGEWMADRKIRDRIVVATKFTSDYRSWEVGKGNAPNSCGNHKRSIHTSVRDSLRKLQTDFIDILYLHWWDYTTSIEEIMDSLHILVQQGKVLYLGVSDTPAWVVSAANTYARSHGKTPFSIYQGQWNVMRRDFERDIIPMARHFGMALAPWDVLGGGKFKSRKEIEQRKADGENLRSVGRPPVQTEEEKKMCDALEKVAGEHNIKSLTAIALAYVMQKAPNVFPIVGGRKVEHLDGNIEALKIKLTDEQFKYLESVSSFEIGFPQTLIGQDPHITGVATPLVDSMAKVAFVKTNPPITPA